MRKVVYIHEGDKVYPAYLVNRGKDKSEVRHLKQFNKPLHVPNAVISPSEVLARIKQKGHKGLQVTTTAV